MHGFAEVRKRGSHVIMQTLDPDGTVTVPAPNHRELRVGTLMSIIRQSGLHRSKKEPESAALWVSLTMRI